MTHAAGIHSGHQDGQGGPSGRPYSQGIKAGGCCFVAGEKVSIHLVPGKIVPGGIEAETRRTGKNVKAISEAAGSSLDPGSPDVCLHDRSDRFPEDEYHLREYFTKTSGRTTVEVANYPPGPTSRSP